MMEWLLQQVDPLAQQLFTGGWNLLDLAWLGVFILMTMEEMGLPAPFVSDAVVLGLGYSSGVGHAQGVAKFVILLFLVVGSSLTGASAVYWAARVGSRPLLLRLSSRLGAQGHLERVESWMNRRSWAVIILARLTPGLLTASSVVAGTARVPYWLFCIYVAISAGVWAGAIFGLGFAAGRGATALLAAEHRIILLQLLVGLVLVVASLWLVRRLAALKPAFSRTLRWKAARGLTRSFPSPLPARNLGDEDRA
jgi:membrane protein DedA with SNARE-associated domain